MDWGESLTMSGFRIHCVPANCPVARLRPDPRGEVFFLLSFSDITRRTRLTDFLSIESPLALPKRSKAPERCTNTVAVPGEATVPGNTDPVPSHPRY